MRAAVTSDRSHVRAAYDACVPAPDEVIAGKYRLVSLLGEGGMGAVWIAENVVLHKRVALKLLRAASDGDRALPAEHVDRFLREATLASRVRHPAIVQVHDAGVDHGVPWIAMELLAGESLSARLTRGPLTSAELVVYVLPIVDALAALHEHGIVHRDLKPDNVFLERCADAVVRPKLLDFGIAKQQSLAPLTKTGTVIGTAYYLSPEQARGSRDLDGRSDLYAIGVVLFEALSGSYPYEAQSLTELIAKMFTEPPRDLVSLAPATSPALAAVVRQCLEREPAARPATARSLYVQLARALGTDVRDVATAPTMQAPSSPPPIAVIGSPAPAHSVRGPGPLPFGSSGASTLGRAVPGISPSAGVAGPEGLGRLAMRHGWWLALLVLFPCCCCWGSQLLRACASVGAGAVGSLGLQWGGSAPLAIDVDGHGPTDAVGTIVRVEGMEAAAHLAAIDGANGSLIWESERVPTPSLAGTLGLTDDGEIVVLAGPESDALTFDRRDGTILGRASLRDRAQGLCRPEEGGLAIAIAGGQFAPLDAAGRIGAPQRGDCPRASSESVGFGPGPHTSAFVPADDVALEAPGMEVRSVVRHVSAPLVVGLGWRASGTDVPMIAIVHEGTLVAVTDITDRDPLSTRSGAPGPLLLGGPRVIAFYSRTTARSIASFDVTTGARVFDVDLRSTRMTMGGAAASTDRIWCASSHVLDAYDATTGEHIVRVGHD